LVSFALRAGIAPAPNYGKSLFRAGQAGFIKAECEKHPAFAFARVDYACDSSAASQNDREQYPISVLGTPYGGLGHPTWENKE